MIKGLRVKPPPPPPLPRRRNNNSNNNSNNNNNNDLHLYNANRYMNIFGCALQCCYIKFMLKVTKARETIKTYNKKY